MPRQSNRYRPGQPFKISRSKVELFMQCPRCFYLDRVCGIDHPPSFPLPLNSAIDTLLKREFDYYRSIQAVHPLVAAAGLDLIPYNHPSMDVWRHNFTGVQTAFDGQFTFIGAVDDIWVDRQSMLYVVDYKSTAKEVPVTTLDQPHHAGYKRQAEFYQWLLRRNGFNVSNRFWFVYCTGDNTAPDFNNQLRFNTHLIPFDGNCDWIEPKITELIACLNGNIMPASGNDCNYCKYVNEVNSLAI